MMKYLLLILILFPVFAYAFTEADKDNWCIYCVLSDGQIIDSCIPSKCNCNKEMAKDILDTDNCEESIEKVKKKYVGIQSPVNICNVEGTCWSESEDGKHQYWEFPDNNSFEIDAKIRQEIKDERIKKLMRQIFDEFKHQMGWK
jgi:hypothetical protein